MFKKVEVVKKGSTIITRYKPTKQLYIKAINVETGEVAKKRVLEFSKHENVKCYRIEHPKFKTFWVTEDHSLIAYNHISRKYEKVSPKQILEDRLNYSLVKETNGKLELIPCNEVKIVFDPEKTTAYDFTVEDFYTFATADGVFLQDTMWFARVSARDFEKTHMKSFVKYDHNDSLLYGFRHEMIVAAYKLSSCESGEGTIEINSLQDLPEDKWYKTVRLRGKEYKYGLALLNKWAGFSDIKFNKVATKKSIKELEKLILADSKDYEEYYKRCSYLMKRLLAFISLNPFTLALDDFIQAHIEKPDLPHNPIIGVYLTDYLTDKALEKIKGTDLYMLYHSGSRLSRTQFTKLCVTGGYVSDPRNKVLPRPIKHSVVEGLTHEEMFVAAQGTRKAIFDKSEVTPDSGYFERTLVFCLSGVEISEDDCGTLDGIQITVPEDLVHFFGTRYWRYPEEKQWRHEPVPANKLIILRTPIKCKTKWPKICKKCANDFHLRFIGVVAAQCIAERFTQLILRTFHTSGTALLEKDPIVQQAISKLLITWDRDRIVLKKDPDIQRIIEKTNPSKVEEKDNQIILYYDEMEVDNADIINKLNKLLSLFKKKNESPLPIEKCLLWLLSEYKSIGHIYSTLIEVMLSMLYWRRVGDRILPYRVTDEGDPITIRIYSIPKHISTCLSMLYTPNTSTFHEFFENPTYADTIHEKIWLKDF